MPRARAVPAEFRQKLIELVEAGRSPEGLAVVRKRLKFWQRASASQTSFLTRTPPNLTAKEGQFDPPR